LPREVSKGYSCLVPLSPLRTRLLRRSSGQWLIALSCALVSSAVGALPATAATLPPTNNPLPDSTFQGADGNQDNPVAPSTNIDWQAMQAAGRAYHAPDPNDEDSAFTGGSEEDEPGKWDLTVERGGVNPAKANIVDAWFAADQGGADTFGYGGFARQEEGGSAFLTFELNHDARLWNNGRATIPCRRTDDLLISYEPQGNDVDVIVQRWVTQTDDAATGCARTGRLDDLAGLTPNVDAQGAINAGAITARLPGFYDGTVPAERFGEAALNLSRFLGEALGNRCFAFGSVWMHSRSSPSESANMQDYVAPETLALRSCAASGVKFHDVNGNGRRDAGEPGLQGWTIWADYDNDGIRATNEPFGITDDEGQYVVNDIRPPRGRYWLRETLPTSGARRRAARAFVRCSYPTTSAPGGMFPCAWGPIFTAQTTYARGRDFGNYESAELVVQKELEPSADPGRFDLLVNRRVVVAAAGDGARRVVAVAPGTYTVSEVAVAGTNPADYRSSVECKREARRTQRRAGGVYERLQLSSRERVVCTFQNVRPGSPAIDIDKTGPATAEAGDTLRYTLYVTNPGDLPFPADSVRVTDPACDSPPALVGKADAAGTDDSPGTLDPGDTWTYACSRKTNAASDCQPTVVPNTATVTGTTGGSSVTDSSTIETLLRCPPPAPIPPQPQPQPQPQPPPPPQPQPPPSPLVPPGPKPPQAGDAARAGFLFRQATRGCLRTRVPRLNFEGTRIARVQVFVNGQLRRRLTVRSLQRRVTPRVRLGPGRYRVSVRVTFQRGTGSPPVTLRRIVRVCGASRPPFTG
jgi:uncharacterized repeat protein (TIGR01451 family)